MLFAYSGKFKQSLKPYTALARLETFGHFWTISIFYVLKISDGSLHGKIPTDSNYSKC